MKNLYPSSFHLIDTPDDIDGHSFILTDIQKCSGHFRKSHSAKMQISYLEKALSINLERIEQDA